MSNTNLPFFSLIFSISVLYKAKLIFLFLLLKIKTDLESHLDNINDYFFFLRKPSILNRHPEDLKF